ncbi:MAG: recombinase family protein [Eubacterium sp.]|nr:recombinase family protein [Eubacterium sp.]
MSMKVYHACIYARLSRDDGDKPESDSITNQKALIRDYLSKHPEIHVVSEKTDDGYSGVSFDRPAFQEMMDEIRSGKVNCVVVKDLSRFGRNYIESGNYIERVFPFMGVRFIAINDSYDSLDKNQSDSLIIPFKNLINDAYCKDISVKIRSQLEIKRKKGQFVGAFAVYGYLKDEEDHNRLVIDTYASEVVRAIFKWKLEGMSQGRIADKLNMQGVLCPMEYKLSLGMKVQTNFRVHKKAMWSPVSVTRILTNEIYTGVLVQGKSGTPNYKVKKVMPKDKEEWIRVEDSHPAIVTKRNFDTVQRIMQRDIRIAPAEETVYPFSGYLKCADCGQSMVRKHYTASDKEYTYFICSTRKAKKGCSTHSIDEETLMASVLNVVKSHIDMVLEAEQLLEMVESLPENQQNVFNYDAQIVKLKEEIERNKNFKLKLYENLQEGMIGQDEYFLFKKSYAMKIQEAEQAIAAIEAEREQMVNNNREQLSWTEVFKQYQNITEVTRNVVVDLIDHIEILEGKGIHVVFRYHDNWDKLIAAISNIPADMKSQMAV